MKFATSGGDAKGNLIANNIFVCDTPEDVPMVGSAFDISGNRFRNNCYWHLRGEPRFDLSGQDVRGLEVFMKAVKGEGEISAEPLLADAGTGDFHLRPGSPCRGGGATLASDGRAGLSWCAAAGGGAGGHRLRGQPAADDICVGEERMRR